MFNLKANFVIKIENLKKVKSSGFEKCILLPGKTPDNNLVFLKY